MRIGIDYFPAATHAPGVGRYARELTRALSALGGQHELRLFELGRAPQVMPVESLGLAPGTRRRRWPVPARAGGWLARLGLGADRLLGGVDLFHQVRLDGPAVSRAPQTFAVSEWPAPEEEPAFLRRLARFEALFVFCAEYRERLVQRAGRREESVQLVPVGADHWLRDLGRPLPSVERADPPRVLVLGAPFRERRHLEILEACERLHRGGREVQLLFAGSTAVGARQLRPRVEASSLAARVQWRAPAERELPRLVAESSLLVHFCADAGTAVTPLEALLLNVPVLVSPVRAFHEVLGRSAHYYEGADVTALAQAIDAHLEDTPAPELRARLAERFSWRENALASLAAWERLA